MTESSYENISSTVRYSSVKAQMKKQWSGEQEDRVSHRSSSLASAAALHARITSMAMSGPSGVSGVSRKHGFSLRRLFGGGNATYGRGATPINKTSVGASSGSKAALASHSLASDADNQSENSYLGSTTNEKDVGTMGGRAHRESFRIALSSNRNQGNCAQPVSSDSESISSSARIETPPSLAQTTSGLPPPAPLPNDSCRVILPPIRHQHSIGQLGALLECPLCLLELPPECFPGLSSCDHRACFDCLQQYLKIEITESRVNISCPHCSEPLHPNDIRMVLNDETMMAKYEEFLLRRVLVTEPDIRWCPAPDCGYAVIASGCAGCPKLKCERPGCETYFCYHCKQEWHPNQTCDNARAQRARHSPNPRSASVSFSQDSIAQRDDIKMCPCCKALIVKMDDGSCNHLTCSVCGTEFCWLCMKEISDLHYLSPSGCTFWGKKPWSRKKKILWQLGMLVGAPVGIALIAGIAVPAIIIGIPVWVGRKLFAKYNRQNSNKHKRNLVVSSGVMASILVSPMLAAIAVGIGVPILLAYVYGVVPISLCRSGGCGVTTSASGVRIEFDEENDIGIGSSLAADGVSVDTAVSHRGVNPSIGEVSFQMSTSLSLGSGCHLERVGYIRERDSDRESASNTAIAGHSLTGSIASASIIGASSSCANNATISNPNNLNSNHKLEVQVDVANSNKRLSLTSETASATVSLSERSANMSMADETSS